MKNKTMRDGRGQLVLLKKITAMMEAQKAETGRVNKSEIARQMGIDRTTVHRILQSKRMSASDQRKDAEEQPEPVAYEDLDPEIQKLLEWSPEAFLGFVERFREPGPRDLPGVPGFVREVADAIFKHDQIVINIPPRHAKSEYWAVWFLVWLICRDRNVQIILVSKTHDQAMKHARKIGFILERHHALIQTFGRFKPIATDLAWRPGRGELLVEGRSVTTESGDLTLQIRGAGQGILGMAAHFIIADDPVDPDSARSGADNRKLLDWFETEVLSRMEPDCRVVVLGQRLSTTDLYGYLINLQYEEEDDGEFHPVRLWHNVVFPAVLDYETKQLLWPERFSWKYFMRKRAQNKAKFEANYQQNPTSEGSILALREWIYGDEEHPGCLDEHRRIGEGLKRFESDKTYGQSGMVPIVRVISIDPAPVNWTSMVVMDIPYVHIGAAEKNFWTHLIDIRRDRMGPREISAQLEQWLDMYGPVDYVVFEKNAYNRWVTQDPSWENLTHRVRVINHETGKNKQDEGYGLKSLATDFELGRIRIPFGDAEARQMFQPLIDEATTYPDGDSDDVLMSLWFVKWQMDRLIPVINFVNKQREGGSYHVPKRLKRGYQFMNKRKWK